MGKITIFSIIACAIALFSFLIYDYATGTVEDAMIDVSGQVVKESQIDTASKSSILGTFSILKIAGVLGTIGGIGLILKKYF